MDGMIDEVAIYQRALTKEEINLNINSPGLAMNTGGKLTVTWGEIKVSR